MKIVKDIHELARIINWKKMPVIHFDLNQKDSYGYMGTKVDVKEPNSSCDEKYVYNTCTLRAFDDSDELVIQSYGACLKMQDDFSRLTDMLENSQNPTIEADQDVLVCFTDSSRLKSVCLILHTESEVNSFTTQPLRFTDKHIMKTVEENLHS